MGNGCAQSGGGPIPAPLGSSGYISLTPVPFALYIKPSYVYILMDRMEPLILGLPKSRTMIPPQKFINRGVITHENLFSWVWHHVEICLDVYNCARQKYWQLPGSRAPWNWSAEREVRGGRGDWSGPGPPSREGKDQLESSRDRGNIMRNKEEPVRDVMREDKQPTE